jgi:NitT/TauT family transport system permease protein
MKDRKNKILNLILPLITIVAIVCFWAVASKTIDNEYILPSVMETASSFVTLFSKGEFYLSLLYTFIRSLVAFLFSFVVGFCLAVLSAKNVYASRVVSPVVSVLRALPTIAVILLLLFWTNSQIAPIVVTVLVVLPTVYTNVKNALTGIDKTVCEASRVDGAGEIQVFCKIEAPLIKSTIYSAIGSGFSLNFKLMVAAEVIAQTAKSIGYMLNSAKVYFETAEMIALVCVAVIVGLIVESVFNLLSERAKN